MSKAHKIKGWGQVAVAANSIKDDAKLGAKVREIVAAIHQEMEVFKALEVLKHQENEKKKVSAGS